MSQVLRRQSVQPNRPVANAGVGAGTGTRQRVAVDGRVWMLRGLDLLSLLCVGLVAVALVCMARDWLARSPIRQVTLAGDLTQVDKPELQAALNSVVRGNYFNANLDDVQAVALRFPWVADARVSRQWPNRLQVTVQEKQAVARWANEGLLSSQGDVFRPRVAHDVAQLPQLSGPRMQAAFVLSQYQAMDSVLRRVGLRISGLSLTDRMSWIITLENGVQILVDGQDTLPKLERFTVLYDRQLAADMGTIARIDLRYRNGIAVGWRHS